MNTTKNDSWIDVDGISISVGDRVVLLNHLPKASIYKITKAYPLVNVTDLKNAPWLYPAPGSNGYAGWAAPGNLIKVPDNINTPEAIKFFIALRGSKDVEG